MTRKFIFGFFFGVLCTYIIIVFDFLLNNGLTLLKHFNLRIIFIHFIFVFENHILVDVSIFEFKVL